MGENSSIGFGGFLLGLGAGWLVFSEYTLTVNTFAYVLMIIGGAVILSGVVRMLGASSSLSGLLGGAAGGLVLALLLTQGFGFIGTMGGVNWGVNRYTATDSKHFSGDLTAASTLFKADNPNGAIQIKTWSQASYDVTAEVKAYGSTQQEADQRLRDLKINIVKGGDNSKASLEFTYTPATQIPGAYSINLTVTLPASALNDLDVKGMNGELTVSDLKANSVRVSTVNGRVALDRVQSVSVRCSTLNGALTGEVDAEAFDASTTNGKIDFTIIGKVSGKYSLSNVNGAINMVNRSPSGYDVDASTTNGEVKLSLPNLAYSTNTKGHKVAQTVNLEKYPTKTVLDLRTVNGNIDVGTTASATY